MFSHPSLKSEGCGSVCFAGFHILHEFCGIATHMSGVKMLIMLFKEAISLSSPGSHAGCEAMNLSKPLCGLVPGREVSLRVAVFTAGRQQDSYPHEWCETPIDMICVKSAGSVKHL